MYRGFLWFARRAGLLLALLPGAVAVADEPTTAETRRLRARVGDDTAISIHPATGVTRFVRLAPGSTASLSPLRAGSPEAKAEAFFREHARLFGIRDVPAELRLLSSHVDSLGMTHLAYQQVHRGIPVFAGLLRAHFDRGGRMTAANGTFVPGIDHGTRPRVEAGRAASVALARAVPKSEGEAGARPAGVRVLGTTLVVFRTGLVQGVTGESHLAWEIEVGNGGDIRQDVFVDALTGAYLDAHDRVHTALDRRVFDGANSPTSPGPNYPGNPFWSEGDPFPTAIPDADQLVLGSGETYNHFENAFAFDSGGLYPFFPNTNGQMRSIFHAGWLGADAQWNRVFAAFGPGLAVDDVTGHEFAHAYTQFTSGLIYQWQSGALNESYSDVWGETVDVLNGRGLDAPSTPRVSCHAGYNPPGFTVNAPPAIAGDKPASPSLWTTVPTTLTADLTLADDGIGLPSDGCQPFTVPAGHIALVDNGGCGFALKADNAFNAGAAGMVVVNDEDYLGEPIFGSPVHPIPSVMIFLTDGNAIKAELPNGPVNATILLTPPTDPSLRWMIGEETSIGGFRDLWNPNCFGHPGRVAEAAFYFCGTVDSGGVHRNSGVVNHAYSLLMEGGTYNGHDVAPIGLTKAAHLWFRAQGQYLVPASDFPDMADALEQSCLDLTGLDLETLSTGPPGGPSGQVIGPGDCGALAQAIAATELRLPPSSCNFQPVLDPAIAPLCPAGQVAAPFLLEGFEADPFPGGWTATTGPTSPDFTPRAWTWENALPDRAGSGMFAVDFPGGTCLPGGDESGVIELGSPAFVMPAASSRVAFDHWVATEPGYDGGNLKISVNGGAFTLVPPGAFTFNAYNLPQLLPSNPLAPEPGFSGTDGGTVRGSWGRSVVDLTSIASAGDSVRLRFDLGNDGCFGVIGWYLDDLIAYSCQAPGGGNPGIGIDDVAVAEGDAGAAAALFTVTLSPADPSGPHSVDFTTQDGSASVVDEDYFSVHGTLLFAPGETSKTVAVSVLGDTRFEADESYVVSLANAVGATILDGLGEGTILNDDQPLAVQTRDELAHGSRETQHLDSIARSWRISQKARSSYEVIVDATTGDIGAGGPDLLRLDADGVSVLQTGVSASGGSSKSLRFENATPGDNDQEFIRVVSLGCSADCDVADTFRIRAFDTTYRIPRFNNSATQVTVILIANPTDQVVGGTLWFHDAAGTLLVSQSVSLQPKATLVLDSSAIPPLANQAGTMTLSNDAPYGTLAGKAVAVEPATGFTFDTPMSPRPAKTQLVPRGN